METKLQAVLEALRTVKRERDEARQANKLLQRERDDANALNNRLETKLKTVTQQRDLARSREEFCYDYGKRVEKELLIELTTVKQERNAAQAKLETVEQERDAANERAKLLSCPCIEEFECEEC